MTKDYLNRQERETIAAMLLIEASLDEFLKHNEKHMSGQERKYCKMAKAFILNFYGHLVVRLGAKENDKVMDLVKKERLTFSSQSVIDTKDKIVMDQDSFADVAEGIIEGYCAKCRKGEEQIHACKVREILLTADVPPADPYDCCPYRMKG